MATRAVPCIEPLPQDERFGAAGRRVAPPARGERGVAARTLDDAPGRCVPMQ